jgi:hypothetical protein
MYMSPKQKEAFQTALYWCGGVLDPGEIEQARALVFRKDLHAIDIHALVGSVLDLAYKNPVYEQEMRERHRAIREVRRIIGKYQPASMPNKEGFVR